MKEQPLLLGSSLGSGGLGLGLPGSLCLLGLFGCRFLGFLGTLCLPPPFRCLLGSSGCFFSPLGPFGLLWLLLSHHHPLTGFRRLFVQLEGARRSAAFSLDQRLLVHQAPDGDDDPGFVFHHIVPSGFQNLLQGCQGHPAALCGPRHSLQDQGWHGPLLGPGPLFGRFDGAPRRQSDHRGHDEAGAAGSGQWGSERWKVRVLSLLAFCKGWGLKKPRWEPWRLSPTSSERLSSTLSDVIKVVFSSMGLFCKNSEQKFSTCTKSTLKNPSQP